MMNPKPLRLPVLLGSVRRGRQSPRVARYIHDRLAGRGGVATELLDLAEYDLPIMEERLRMRDDPPPRLDELSRRIGEADGLAIVSPEYNNSYPGVLKNALDYLHPEFRRKPVGIVTVSAGGFGGVNCLAMLRLVLLAMGALPIPVSLPVSRVGTTFTDDGRPTEDGFEERADRFLDELTWLASAIVEHRRATGES